MRGRRGCGAYRRRLCQRDRRRQMRARSSAERGARTARSRASAISPSGRSCRSTRLETLVVSGACDCFELPSRQLLWQLGLVPLLAERPRSAVRRSSSALPLDPTAATPELPEPTVWERMLADSPHDEPLGRRPSVGAACARDLPAEASSPRATSRTAAGPRAGGRLRAWPSRGSGRRPRTASSSC